MADYEQLKQLVIDGDGEGTIRVTRQLIDSGAGARAILDGGLLPAMDIVGERMRSGESFIPEVLLSARTMQGALDILKPLLAEGDTGNTGTAVIGTVEGDLHDIGKNLVAMMLEGAGFKVVNLGTGVTVAQFIAAVKEHKPQIVGMSALLTTTVGRMPEVIAALKADGLRDSVKVMVGGAPVTQAYADEIGADGYGANAAMAVDHAKSLIA
jgi:5-methyltetrahydrofolate--homocysteine methyltransferase